jgi:hydrogenase maturation protease
MDDLRIAVVGLGNILLGDEGIGVHAVRVLEQRFCHPRINYYDGGTLGLILLPLMEKASHLMLLDAVSMEKDPGTLVEIPDESLFGSISLKFSAHDIALSDLLALLRLRRASRLKKVVLLGVVPYPLTLSTDLSSEAEKSLHRLVQRAEEILRVWAAQIEGGKNGPEEETARAESDAQGQIEKPVGGGTCV